MLFTELDPYSYSQISDGGEGRNSLMCSTCNYVVSVSGMAGFSVEITISRPGKQAPLQKRRKEL